MPKELRLAVARWTIGRLRGEELPEIACRAIERGLDSPALAELASMRKPTLRDAEPILVAAMRELGIDELDRRSAGFTLAAHYASLILDGTWSPYEGARRIWHEVFDAIDHPAELAPFMSGASEIEDFNFARPGDPNGYDDLIAKSEQEIRVAAAKLLKREV